MIHNNIDYGTKVQNFWIGCCKKSNGCKFCWAIDSVAWMERLSESHAKKGRTTMKQTYNGLTKKTEKGSSNWTGKIVRNEKAFVDARKDRNETVLVNFMSDTFHADVPTQWRVDLFNLIADNEERNNNYFILTKRPDLAVKFVQEQYQKDTIRLVGNVYIGVSVESNEVVDRIDALRGLFGYNLKRWVSIEPMIGRVDLTRQHSLILDWIVVGGESGKNARPIEKEWVLNVRDFAEYYNIPFYFKQWGKREFNPDTKDLSMAIHKKGGFWIDGVVHRMMPKGI